MGKIVRRGIDFSGGGGGGSSSDPTAASVTFNNTDTGLEAVNVQDAITEVNDAVSALNKSGNLLNNKTIVFLGDSITVGLGWQNEIGDTTNKYGWAKIIQEHFPTATVKNLAVSGACIANTGNYIDVISQYGAMSNTEQPDYYTPNPDYIIFSGGGNDGLNSVNMGTICNGFAPAYENINTTIGALEYMFANAYNTYPTARKGFIITQRLTDAVEEYYDAIRNVCQKWSIPVLDLSRVSEINAFIDGIATTYFPTDDRVHPNEKCYREILAPKVEEWLISGFINSSSRNPTAASVTFNNTNTGLNATNVQDAVTEVNGKLANYGNDKKMGKLLSYADNYVLDMFKKASTSYSPTFGELNIGGPVVAYIMQKHSDYYGGGVIVFGYNNFRPIYYHIANGTIDAEYYL